MKLQGPKGTRDFYPEDMALRNWIAQRWVDVSRRHGFVEYDGPIFEPLDLYRIKSGDEIVAQLFHFEDRGGRAFAIRPEMTPTLARMVAARANSLARPIKWFSIPRLCRAERPQRGRLREFFQWNIDIVGVDDALADAECIFVAVDFFQSLGLAPEHVSMRINSRAVVSALLHHVAIPDAKLSGVFAALDKRDKLSAGAFAETLDKLELDGAQRSALIDIGDAKGPEGLARIEKMLTGSAEGTAACAELRQVFHQLAAFGVADYCVYDMGVVRGLAYYTGTVFEAFGKGGLQRAICGGGRYDELVSNLGGPPMGGVGFATSDVVIGDVLAEFNLLPELQTSADYFIIDADAEMFDSVLSVVGRLRSAGIDAAFSYNRQGVSKQFKQASARNVRRVAIVERDFAKTQTLTVKDMATGRQAPIAISDLLRDPLGELPSAT
jgi:histidyl-tRNA synthetase